jgi:hydroxymethylglutaryl-CoA lyase
MADVGRSVRIRDVGPRDGLQNEPEVLSTGAKVSLIEALVAAGVRRLEATSFVRPDLIPQLADASEVLDALALPDDVSVSVLIPNERGLDAALRYREKFDEVSVFLSASESHNQANVNRSVEESLRGLREVVRRSRESDLRCEGVISVSFGDPYEGYVDPERVLGIAEELVSFGAQEISFGDTTGMANPVQVSDFFTLAASRLPGIELTAHFHDSRGQGIANCIAALEVGVRSFETSVGGVGGCPVPAGSKGNVSSEELIHLLHEMGWRTGIDIELMLGAAELLQTELGRTLDSRLMKAGPIDWHEVAPTQI